MKSALAILVLFVFAGTVYTQTGTVGRSGKVPPTVPPDGTRLEPYKVDLPDIPKEPTIEQLAEQIVNIRNQKAALEKKEQNLIAQLRVKVGKQTEMLNKLGLGDHYPYLVPGEPGGGRAFPIIPTPGTGPDSGPALAPGAAEPPGSVPAPGSIPAIGSPSLPCGAPGTNPPRGSGSAAPAAPEPDLLFQQCLEVVRHHLARQPACPVACRLR